MQYATLYEKQKKNNSFIINFWRCNNNITLYKSYVYYKHKISLVRCSNYFREQ